MAPVNHSTFRVRTRSVPQVPASSRGWATADATSKRKASSGVKNPTPIKAFELTMATGSDEGRGGVTSAKHRGLGLPTQTEELRLALTRGTGCCQSRRLCAQDGGYRGWVGSRSRWGSWLPRRSWRRRRTGRRQSYGGHRASRCLGSGPVAADPVTSGARSSTWSARSCLVPKYDPSPRTTADCRPVLIRSEIGPIGLAALPTTSWPCGCILPRSTWDEVRVTPGSLSYDERCITVESPLSVIVCVSRRHMRSTCGVFCRI